MADDSTLALLRLLADGADTAAVGRVSADPQARELALSAARLLEDQRRRERELRALVDTARDLAAAHDPERVLDAIVHRTRMLLGTDVAYLTLFDADRGDTYMRATDGTVAASFRALRLELGAGLGGLVASTLQPWWSPDYPHDQRFAHTPTIDSGVADEGLVAICGTPLVVGGDFVGVLFAANRSRHAFTHEEVGLLGSLATLAAVSIVQVRALHETQATLRELSLAHDAVRRHGEAIERSAAAHDRFSSLVVAGGGVDDITRALVDLLGGWAVLVDAKGMRRSEFGPAPGAPAALGSLDPLSGDPVVEQARAAGRVVSEGNRYAVLLRAGTDPMAVLSGEAQTLAPADWRIVERAAMVTALVLLFERQAELARQRVRSDLVADLVTGALDPAEASRLGRAQGFDPTVPFCVVCLRPTTQPVSSLVLAAGAAVGGGGLVGEHGRTVLILVPGEDPGTAARHLVERMHGFGEVTAAGVGPITGPDGIPAAAAEARRTVDTMLALGRRGEAVAATDLGFAGLVVGSTPDVADYVRRVLGPVLDYDRAHDTELRATLEAFFAAGRSAQRAAEPLHVHANTVTQRLSRISALLGEEWTDPDPSLEIQLALRLRLLLPPAARRRARRE